MRLPALPPEAESPNKLTEAASAPTRGMQVLNGILDKRSRNGWTGIRGGRSGRLWLTATIVVGLSCAAYIVRFAGVAPLPEISAETDLFADDEFETEPVPQPVSRGAQQTRGPAEAKQVGSGSAPDSSLLDSSVHAAVYETSQSIRTRVTWFDGTIDSDDSNEQ